MKQILLLTPFYRWGNWGTETNILPKVTRLVSSRASTRTSSNLTPESLLLTAMPWKQEHSCPWQRALSKGRGKGRDSPSTASPLRLDRYSSELWESDGRVQKDGQTMSSLPKMPVPVPTLPSVRGSFQEAQSYVACRLPQSRDLTSCPPSNCPSMFKALLNPTEVDVGTLPGHLKGEGRGRSLCTVFLGVEWEQFGDTLSHDGTVVHAYPGPQQKWELTKKPRGMPWTWTQNWATSPGDFISRNAFLQQIFSKHLLCDMLCANIGDVEMTKTLAVPPKSSAVLPQDFAEPDASTRNSFPALLHPAKPFSQSRRCWTLPPPGGLLTLSLTPICGHLLAYVLWQVTFPLWLRLFNSKMGEIMGECRVIQRMKWENVGKVLAQCLVLSLLPHCAEISPSTPRIVSNSFLYHRPCHRAWHLHVWWTWKVEREGGTQSLTPRFPSVKGARDVYTKN